ncbi:MULTISPECIES: protein-L-isoaspartate(D-aspartate) O-methyltransferase [unclassified Roseitalea]|uniref:protein-L-isoaspartate(D-aspartate) O-methyltransferase n=1 Tax=unclassified Roseitalea TaxID=2639107 RepID=UPI00273D18B0|nr:MULTISPECIES: protein-L-isoaspartate(D-aspartate) O-methyltransferase [unclassified Roseitalea]
MTTAHATDTGPAAVDRESLAAFLLRMRAAGIDDKALLKAIEAVPRREFADPQFHDAVWSSRMIPIDCGETIEGLDHQARVLAELALDENQRVLEIGTGSGYTAAVMGKLTRRVYSIERFRRLRAAAQARLRALKIDNVIVSHGDGLAGSDEGPFDRIVVWPALTSVPRGFTELLVSGGKLICAIGEADERQVLVRLTKVGSRYEREDIGTVRAQLVVAGLPEAL